MCMIYMMIYVRGNDRLGFDLFPPDVKSRKLTGNNPELRRLKSRKKRATRMRWAGYHLDSMDFMSLDQPQELVMGRVWRAQSMGVAGKSDTTEQLDNNQGYGERSV